eukprot:Lankesteria_metandrocarpae@DN5248_c0_g1_i1.p4
MSETCVVPHLALPTNHDGTANNKTSPSDESIPKSGPKRYRVLDSHIGQGTFGKVEKAMDLLDNSIVAIKKVKVEQKLPAEGGSSVVAMCGIHFTVIREIKVMREIKHDNIISIKDVYVEGDFINLVMPHMTCDLRKLLDKRIRLTESQIKCLFQQIVLGVAALHKYWFIHRDLAPANIFIDNKGICKVADFGLSRTYGSPRGGKKTPKVVTLWYRAPELLYGASMYHNRIDSWAVGCIFAELLSGGKPLFPGMGELDQLARIFEVCGTPDENNWPDAVHLPVFIEFTHCPPKDLRNLYPGVSEVAIDLLKKLLALDPLKRISCAEALASPYFSSLPQASNPSDIPLSLLE